MTASTAAQSMRAEAGRRGPAGGRAGVYRHDHRFGLGRTRLGEHILHFGTLRVDLQPQGSRGGLGDRRQGHAGVAAHDHRGLCRGGPARHGDLTVGVKALLIGNRADDDRREVLVAKQRARQVQIPRGNIHPWTQRDAIGDGPVAAQNRGNLRRSQHETRLSFVLEHIHELRSRHQGRRRNRHAKRRRGRRFCRRAKRRHRRAHHAGGDGRPHHPDGLAARRHSCRRAGLFGHNRLVIRHCHRSSP